MIKVGECDTRPPPTITKKTEIMCILITKEKGVHFPSVRNIENSIAANPDGFAMAWNEDGEVRVFKSMNPEEFMDAYKALAKRLSHRDTAMMLHMRIATHGSVGIKNCHCWKCNVLGSGMAFAHNGILRIPNRADMTDSETFLRDYVEPCETLSGVLNNIHTYIGTSKFAFIDGYGNLLRFGDFLEQYGVQYSNRSFMGYGRRSADPRLWGAKYSPCDL